MNTEQKTIFITGAASGMGLATARLFAKNGWFIGICDVNKQGLESLESEIGAENCHTSVLDVSDRAAYQKVLNAFGEWWILKTGKEKYGGLMEAGGNNLKEFLVN